MITLWLLLSVTLYWWEIRLIRPFLKQLRAAPVPQIPPVPGPDPESYARPLLGSIVRGVGGVVGGWLFTNAWGPEQGGVTAFYAVTTCVGALVGSIIAGEAVEFFMRGRGAVA